MIRPALVGAALVLAAPALGAEGGVILGGEHVGFSRLVLEIEPATEWTLQTAAGRAILAFPGRAIAFSTRGTFEKLPNTRIKSVRPTPGPEGTTVEVDIGCDCLVSALLVGTRWIALDVADPGVIPEGVEASAQHALGEPAPAAAPATENPAAQEAREASIVASAEQILIQQIERAASQGLIQLSGTLPAAAPPPAPPAEAPAPEAAAHAEPEHPAPEAAAHPAPEAAHTQAEPPAPEAAAQAEPEPPAPEATAVPTLPLSAEPPAAAAAVSLVRMLGHEQISATTVFDRDGRHVDARPPEPAPECLPDTAFDIGAWSTGPSMHRQAVELAHGLVGEFDVPDPVALRDLVRLNVRFGFGAEAESLLASFDAPLDDRALLVDLARAVEGRPAAADGPLAVATPCPGRHGLWLALGGVAPAFHTAEHFGTVQAAFADLPVDLRPLLGPALIGRLLDAGRPAEARLIYETTVRPGLPAGPELQLAEARLVAVDGHPVEAVRAMDALVETNAHNAVEALMHLARLAIDEDLPIPERVITDLRAAALQFRGSEIEAPLRALLAEALAERGELGAAIAEIRAARADMPAATGLEALAVALLAVADPAKTGAAPYAETMLDAGPLIAPVPANDTARRAIAGHLIELGLPQAALAMLAPAYPRGEAATRMLAAEAELRLGDGAAAQAALGELPGPEAAVLRARAFALGGDFRAAETTLDAAGRPEAAAPYAWPAGDWPRARDTAERPDRVAMAGYMAARENAAPPPAPAADPAALAPEAAFQEPLPSLVDPSLDAARRLLAAGAQVEDFVERLLEEQQ